MDFMLHDYQVNISVRLDLTALSATEAKRRGQAIVKEALVEAERAADDFALTQVQVCARTKNLGQVTPAVIRERRRYRLVESG